MIPDPKPQSVVFHALDRDAEVEVSVRNLPHWFQADAAIFVTFRTADSLPKEVILRMIAELCEWLRNHGLPVELADSMFHTKHPNHDQLLDQLESKQRRELKKLADQLFHRSLDDCHGDCLLKDSSSAQLVADAIRKFDDVRYDLDSLIVMPNHVHVLVQFRSGYDLATISQSWMRYTARVINTQIGRTGVLWQPEPFDHIIRSAEQFEYLHRYVAENPKKAKLEMGQYLYWQRGQTL
ncbi:MAG: transposase [Planctomycetota bacterium]|nr:transposase [Planctomycetota bacterium]